MRIGRTLLVACCLAIGAAGAADAATLPIKITLHGKQTAAKQSGKRTTVTERLTDPDTGKVVGQATVRIIKDSEKRGHGTGTVKLADGTIRLAFKVKFSAGRTLGKVRGGTKSYRGATGTFKDVNTSATEDDLTIRLKLHL